MANNGVRSTEQPKGALVDEVLGNRDGSTVRQGVSDLSNQLAQTGGIAARFTELDGATGYPALVAATWAALATLSGTVGGQRAEVDTSDSGTHLDGTGTGYDGATVPNAGIYAWEANWSRWVRVGNSPLASKVAYSDGVSVDAAAADLLAVEYDANGVILRAWDADANMFVARKVVTPQGALAVFPEAVEVANGKCPAHIASDDVMPLAFDDAGRLIAVPSPSFAKLVQLAAPAMVDMGSIVSNEAIILWGDSITASGSGWGDGLASALGGSRSVINRAIGGQDTRNIVQRQGGYPIPIDAVTIPASGSVTIALTDGDPYFGTSYSDVACLLAGVAGVINPTPTINEWTFSRIAAGTAVAVDAGTPVILAEQEVFRALTMILQPGPNLSGTPRATRQEWQAIIDVAAGAVEHLTPRVKQFALVGEYAAGQSGETTGDAQDRAASIRVYNAMLKGMVGEAHYIDLHEYGVAQAIDEGIALGLFDGGTYPTADDLTDMSNGLVPRTLAMDGTHPTSSFKTLLARHVALHINLKGI